MNQRLKIGLLLLLGTYLLGGFGYKVLSPSTPLVDCLYMSVITVASVGFGETVMGADQPGVRTYTMALILFGMAVHLYAVSVVTAFVVEGDLSHYFWKKRMSRKIESMNGHFVVCGAGETGMRIIEELLKTRRDFVVVESDDHAVEVLRKMQDVAVIQGLVDDEGILSAAGIERASAAAVALHSDKDNLVATLSIRTLNPKIRIVVKEIEPGMAARFRRAGADAIVNPATIGGLRLVSEMVRPSVVSFLDLMLRDPDHVYRFEELAISSSSPWISRPLKDVSLRAEYNLLVAAARRDGGASFVYNPGDDWLVETGQVLVVLGRAEDVHRARAAAQPA